MALRVPESKFWEHFYRPKPPPKPPKRHLRNPNRTSKSDFWPFFDFGHFPIEIPIEVEKMLGRAFQTCNLKNKNCSELLLTKGMGLDRAPSNFLTLVFSPLEGDPPSPSQTFTLLVSLGWCMRPVGATLTSQSCSCSSQGSISTGESFGQSLPPVLGWFLFSKISEFPIVHVPKLFPLVHKFQNYFCFCSRTFPSHGGSFFRL